MAVRRTGEANWDGLCPVLERKLRWSTAHKWDQSKPTLSFYGGLRSHPSRYAAYPLRKKGSTYEVGLLWKGDERPEDYRAQVMAATNSLVRKLELFGKRPQYDAVLIKEYCELEAIEREPAPV